MVVVMKIIIVIILEDDKSKFFGKLQNFHPSFSIERNRSRVMMMRSQIQHSDVMLLTNLFEMFCRNSVFIYGNRNYFSSTIQKNHIRSVVTQICYDNFIVGSKQKFCC